MKFRNEYWFLSNMYPCKIHVFGLTFENAEAAFQSQKDISRAHEFQTLTGSAAKRLGRHVNMRHDWNAIRNDIMYEVIKAKFTNTDLTPFLLDTGDTYIAEDNTWGDTYWGICNGKGANTLGKILMRVREEIKRQG